MRNFVVRYGILGGSISIALGIMNWLMIAQPFGPKISELLGYTSIVISLLTIPFGIKYYRDKINNRLVSFTEAFKIGMGISLITSLIMGLYGALFFAIEGERFKAWQEKWLTPTELEQIRVQAAAMPEYMQSPIFQGVIMFIMVFLIGFVINILSTVVLVRKS